MIASSTVLFQTYRVWSERYRSLVIKNSDGQGPTQYSGLDEIVVTRKIERDKGSKYFLNDRKRIKINNLMLHAYKIKFMINNIQYNFKANYNNRFEDFLKKNI